MGSSIGTAKEALARNWWGLLVAYFVLVVLSYLGIWAFAEPIGIPDKFSSLNDLPNALRHRWFYHVVLTVVLAAHATLVLELVFRCRAWPCLGRLPVHHFEWLINPKVDRVFTFSQLDHEGWFNALKIASKGPNQRFIASGEVFEIEVGEKGQGRVVHIRAWAHLEHFLDDMLASQKQKPVYGRITLYRKTDDGVLGNSLTVLLNLVRTPFTACLLGARDLRGDTATETVSSVAAAVAALPGVEPLGV